MNRNDEYPATVHCIGTVSRLYELDRHIYFTEIPFY